MSEKNTASAESADTALPPDEPNRPAGEGAKPPESDPVKEILDELAAQTDVRAIVVGFIRKNGAANLRISPNITPVELNHLARMVDVKTQREYAAMLFASSNRPPAGPVRGLPPKVASMLQKAVDRKARGGKGRRK